MSTHLIKFIDSYCLSVDKKKVTKGSIRLWIYEVLVYFTLQLLKKVRPFSHDGKVRILNFNSKCAF